MAGEYKDYYKILGVAKSADDKEIKAAYRKLARKFHPDVNQNDKTAESKFKDVAEAYEILSDKDKRSKYDQYGDQWKAFSQTGQQGGQPGQGSYTDYGGIGGLDDLFASLFGGDPTQGGAAQGFGGGFRGSTRQSPGARRSAPETEYVVDITFDESYSGTTRSFNVNLPETCRQCHGNGAVPAGKNRPCPSCNGTGKGRGRGLFGGGACPQCGGSGEAMEVCPECHGSGSTERQRRISDVKLPAGVKEGQRIRLAGQGANGADLYLKVHIKPDSRYERQDSDLFTEFTVAFTVAALGGSASVDTPAGRKVVNVPPGTQPGQKFRLTGLGMPHIKGGGKGDLYASAKIGVPKDISPRERELIVELARLRKDEVTA